MKIRMFVVALVFECLAAMPGAAQTSNPSHDPTLRPGDMVQLRIWREDTMSGQYLVDESGVVVFPLVGEYHVLQDTPETLREKLLVDYRKYLKNPSIEVTVLRRVRIMGAVYKPGLYQVDPTVTLADALAQAGGATRLGQANKVQIIRDGKTIAVNLGQNTPIADSPLQSGDQLFVPERSWFSIHSNVVASVIAAAVTLSVALFIRH